MGDAIVARPCTAADLRRVRLTWPEAADVCGSHYTGHRAGTQMLLVAWDGDIAAGSAVLRWQNSELPDFDDAYPGVVEVAHLHVRPDVRRRGVGTCLLEAAEREARCRGIRWLGLGVDVESAAAAALYARLGYTSTGVFAGSAYDYVDEDGNCLHAIERNEYLIKELGPGPRSTFKARGEH